MGQDKGHKWILGSMKREISFLICFLVYSSWSLRHPGVQQPQGTPSLKDAARGANALTGTKGAYMPCFSAEISRHWFVSRSRNHEDMCHGLQCGRCSGSKAAQLSSSFRKVWDIFPSVGFWSYFTCLWPNMCKSWYTWRKMWWLEWPWFPRGVICLKLLTSDNNFWIWDDPRILESETWG